MLPNTTFTPQPYSIIAQWLHGTHCTYPQKDGQAELTWVVKCKLQQAILKIINFESTCKLSY